MDWFIVILTSSVFGVLASAIITFLQDKYFDKLARERKTKALAVKLVFVLNKFALKCGMDLCETNQFLHSGGLNEDNNGNYFGKSHSNLPELFLDLDNMNWEGLDVSLISSINNLSLHIIISQSAIDSVAEVLFAEEIIGTYREEISLIGFETIGIINKLCKEYNVDNQNIEKSHYVEELISSYEKFKENGRYEIL